MSIYFRNDMKLHEEIISRPAYSSGDRKKRGALKDRGLYLQSTIRKIKINGQFSNFFVRNQFINRLKLLSIFIDMHTLFIRKNISTLKSANKNFTFYY